MGLAFVGGCGEAVVPVVPAETEGPPSPPAPPALDSPAFGEGSPMRPVFPTADGGWLIPAEPGRIVTLAGVFPVPEGVVCGGGVKISSASPVIAFLPPGEPVDFGEAPATMAAQVERFAWRIADVLGKRAGLRPGGLQDRDPTTWDGIKVRSVKKTRRSGPPLLIGVGDRDGTVVVAVTDRDAERVLGAAVFADAPGHLPVPGTVPAFDADGDGLLDVFVYGTGDTGVFRARVVVDPVDPVRVAASVAAGSAPRVCP